MFQVYKEFLKHEQAWDLACSIDGAPGHWWSKVIKHKDIKTPLYLNNNVGGYRHSVEQEEFIRKSLINSSFTYKFRRTTKHFDKCGCWECSFRDKVLNSASFKDFITEKTGLKNPTLYEYFTSAYHPGDFLSRHTDEQRGIAFVFNLSWKWQPEYGGLLHVESDEGYTTYVPGWGDLVLMNLGKTGQVHFVSEVTKHAPRPRIAISGWYNEG